jgi:ribonuclease HII
MSRPSLKFEVSWRERGHTRVAGVDEAGRGPLAGPVSVAAVVLPVKYKHKRLNDSKQLTEEERESIYEEIVSHTEISWSAVMLHTDEIETLNILRATHEGMRRAVLMLSPVPDAVLIDGLPVPNYPIPHQAVVGGDALSLSIAAASVIAKVTRDRYMRQVALEYPQYGFERHKGYGTPRHLEALRLHGPCPIHRRTFAPVAQLHLALEMS